ncbi:hypothetical protein ACSBR2_027663 [Camellia fascicularis]
MPSVSRSGTDPSFSKIRVYTYIVSTAKDRSPPKAVEAISDICNFSEVMHGVGVKIPTFMPAALEHVNPLNLKL